MDKLQLAIDALKRIEDLRDWRDDEASCIASRALKAIQVVSAKADESGSPGAPSGVGEPGSGVAASALPPAQTSSKLEKKTE